MNSRHINGRHFAGISVVYEQHSAPYLETKCQTGIPSRNPSDYSRIHINRDELFSPISQSILNQLS